MKKTLLLFAIVLTASFFIGFEQNASANLVSKANKFQPVSLSEDENTYTMSNGIVTAQVSKTSGDLVSLKYKGLEMLGGGSGHANAYWSHAPSKKSKVVDAVTIDPKKNGGERVEVSVKGFYQGTNLGEGPGGSTACDIEIRYSLGRDDSGVYTYSILTHKADYPATQIGEARFGAKLNPNVFDWLTIDPKRNKMMEKPEDWDKGTELNMKEARLLNTGIYKGQVSHKYDFSAIQFNIPAFGWSSTKDKVGLWFVNPSTEYLSGGATKVELTGHLDNNEGAAPTLLNYWRGSHYGGSSLVLKQGESWTKVVGPFLIYCNSGANPQAMWKDALAQADKESKKWAYDWVSADGNYPKNSQRGTVSGQIVLNDAGNPKAKMSNLLVGLSAPDYEATGFRGRTEQVSWQTDAKNYEFWTRGAADGKFTISKIRPGKYTLHAIADGVLSEYAQADITVEAGKKLDLGKIEWKPVRYGKQLWEIGIPNRSAEEFKHGDDYWHWGLYTLYPKEFPNDVNFTIGKSDYRTDWNYAQVPRLIEDNGKGGGKTTETTWTINFNLPNQPHGKATLRMGIASNSARNVTVSVNDQPAGETGFMPDTATIRRDGIRGFWFEKNVTFDASLLKPGANTLKLTVPQAGVMNGIQYDYLRLELDESK